MACSRPGRDAVSSSGRRRRLAVSRLPSAARAIGWLVGGPLAFVRYVLVTRKALREEVLRGTGFEGAPAWLRDEDSAPGAAVHRCFSLRIVEPAISAEQLARIVSADPNLVSPWEVLRWELPERERRGLRAGDELLVRMAGPWNGPLRVCAIEPRRLRFETRPGHAVKGELEMRLQEDGEGLLAEIELWERADSRPLAFLHDRLGITTRMQTHTWVEFLQRTRRVSGGRAAGPVMIRTEREER